MKGGNQGGREETKEGEREGRKARKWGGGEANLK